MQIDIKLNGRELTLDHGLDIASLLEKTGAPAKGLVVELNGKIIHKQMYKQTCIKEGDEVELIRLVGGG